MWDTLKTNKKIGVMWPNDADGQSDAEPKTGLRIYYNPDGYSVVDGGRFQNLSEDFTSQISKFKAAGCDIVSGVMIPPDFTNFWKQCFQQGYQPMVNTMAKALLFPSALEALGRSATVCPPRSGGPRAIRSRHRSWADLPGARRRVRVVHRQAVDAADHALRGVRGRRRRPEAHHDVDDKQVIVDAVKATDIQTIAGHITWTAGKLLNPGDKVCVTALTGGQWIKGTNTPSTSMSSTASGPDAAGRGHPDHCGVQGHRLLTLSVPAPRPAQTSPMVLGGPPVGSGESNVGRGSPLPPRPTSRPFRPPGRCGRACEYDGSSGTEERLAWGTNRRERDG